MADPSRVNILCGDVKLPWIVILIAAMALRFEAQLSVYIRGWMHIHVALTALKSWPSSVPTSDILVSTKRMAATDPRDKIFSLYNILNRSGIAFREPDYHKFTPDVYREATIASIIHDQNLKILSYAWCNHNSLDLPSWVPDWNDPPEQGFMSRTNIEETGMFNPVYSFSNDGKDFYSKGNLST